MSKIIRLERPLVVLDLETTGTKVQTDLIVEISLLKMLPDGANQIKTRRLNPGIPIPAEATAIHGITDADVANEYSFRQIARSLVAYLDGCDLIGWVRSCRPEARHPTTSQGPGNGGRQRAIRLTRETASHEGRLNDRRA